MIKWLKKLLPTSAEDARPIATRKPAMASPPPSALFFEESAAHKAKGDAHFDRGELTKAAECYRDAIASDPENAKALNNLACICREQKLFAEAEHYFKRATEIRPTVANVHYNLASLLLARGKENDAIEYFAREFEHQPKHFAALALLLHLKQKVCDWKDLQALAVLLRSAVFELPETAEQIFSPFAFIALPGATREEQKCCAERWVQAEYQSLIDLRPQLHLNHERRHNPKIAIGYLSADFRDHPIARLIANVLELHDREKFDITAYAYGSEDGSGMRKRLKDAVDRFVNIDNLSDVDAARRVHADKIDILIDLTGFTANTRSGILALRPAPIQGSYLGYLGTMGADFVDFLIADEFIIPCSHQEDYAEKILRLPYCFQANDSKRPSPPAPLRSSVGLPESAFIFCCFNQPYKITPDMFDVWCKLLLAVPDSLLWLYSSGPTSQDNLQIEAGKRGIDRSRLVMAPKVSPEQYLARMQSADIFLDTNPYNAGTTCSDALWMGLPVITYSGQTFASRMAGSLLTAIGLPELITYDLQDYYRLALHLATDRAKLKSIRNTIVANRSTSPLFDSRRITLDLEERYTKLFNEHIDD